MTVSPELLRRTVKSYEKDIVKFSRDLIAIPGFSGTEGPVCKRIAKEMKKVGFDKVWFDKMGNVIGQIGRGKTKIMIDSHVDTVQVGDRSQWKWDPFKGKFENGKIYGRGACDQRTSVASMVYAGKAIKQLKLTGDYTLWVVGSVMEVVITEPTHLCVYRGHRGRMEITVTVKGRSCHASAPERGDNPITKMADIVKEIDKLNRGGLKYDKFLGVGTVAVTAIECKTPSFNAVADECTIHLDRRMTKGESPSYCVKEIQKLPSVKKWKGKVEILKYDAVAWTGLKVGQEKYFPTWVLEPNHPLVRAGVKAGTIALGKKPVVDKWTFSTNGVATAGRHGIPTIGFGPQHEIYAHQTNEVVPVDALIKATTFYAAIPQAILAERKRR
jgi:acetylornithine deacetylase/succinyl-diaminopimelate desuccinylase-like protein